jgi:divalent metal cation (Fe/Co/Zn/Cd) transporter
MLVHAIWIVHRIASELEEAVRVALPEIADVVVHTEP